MPIACLMNHAAAAPHVRQYGQLQDGWLHFPASRTISAGEQVHFAKHGAAICMGAMAHSPLQARTSINARGLLTAGAPALWLV